MQKVITINLNGNAFQLEEPGYDALRAYLERAATQLRDNPDRTEILSDLEQAIAEKCSSYLRPHKNVVTTAEVQQVIVAMGPVDDGSGSAESAGASVDPAADGSSANNAGAASAGAAPKRLYQIREGAMISGVCNGLSAYTDIDVTFIRIAFVVLGLLTGGIVVLGYIILMFVIPFANTSEERAAARGAPFNAQELIDRAKKNYSEFKDNRHWRKQWREQRDHMRQQWKDQWRQRVHDRADWVSSNMQRNFAGVAEGASTTASYGGKLLAGLMVPVLGLIGVAWFLLFFFAVVSLATTSALFGWPVPGGMPLWLGILLALLLYNFFAWPLRAMRRASYHVISGHRSKYDGGYVWFSAWDGLLRVALIALVIWYAYEHVPAVQAFFEQLPQHLDNLWRDLRQQDRTTISI